MTSEPGALSGTNSVHGATVAHCAALTRIPKYPLAPLASVHDTTAVLALSSRNSTCSLSKFGSPTIFVRDLYSKYKSFKLMFDVFILVNPLDFLYAA